MKIDTTNPACPCDEPVLTAGVPLNSNGSIISHGNRMFENLLQEFRVEPAYGSNVGTYKLELCTIMLSKRPLAARSCNISSSTALDFLSSSSM